MRYKIEVNCDPPADGNPWMFRALITRHDRAVTTIREKVIGLDMQAVMQLCGDAVTEDIAWQEKRWIESYPRLAQNPNKENQSGRENA